jgi:thymidine phosphorylase
MNEPLASAAGNALEVAVAARFLTGEAVDARLWDVTVALGGELLALAGLAPDAEAGAERMRDAFASGAAAERFDRMVAALGGPSGFLADYARHLPRAPIVHAIEAPAEGFVAAIDGRALGYAVIELGGGRRRPTDRIDPSVGLDALLGLGAHVEPGDALALVHAADEANLAAASARVLAAYTLADQPPDPGPLVLEKVDP